VSHTLKFQLKHVHERIFMKLIYTFLAAVVATSLTGCGNSSSDEGSRK